MLIRLTKKLADIVNGIDLSRYEEGDVIELPVRHARLLIADGWAEPLSASPLPGSRSASSLRVS